MNPVHVVLIKFVNIIRESVLKFATMPEFLQKILKLFYQTFKMHVAWIKIDCSQYYNRTYYISEYKNSFIQNNIQLLHNFKENKYLKMWVFWNIL